MQTNNQYEMLKRCSQNKDLSEWNAWRKENPEKDIYLRGYNFEGFFLKGANFLKGSVYYKPTNVYINYTGEVHLEKANFKSANLENICFGGAILKQSVFHHAEANGADFNGADLEEADLSVTNLRKCNFSGALLKNSRIISSHLEGTNFINAILFGCKVRASVSDNATNFWKVKVNKFSIKCKFTDFSGTSLGNLIIDPGTRQLLEYNIRRMNWEDWYWGSSNHKVLDKDDDGPIWRACRVLWRLLITSPIRLFWWMSDYGLSTGRIILSFSVWAIMFAIAFLLWPSCVMVYNVVGDIRGFVHALYFSVVTMTTLGFGDIAANPGSWFGQVVLMVQVILGYVHLGALVTRFAVLFTAGGPAGKFSKDKDEDKRKTPETS